jgi:hypothetical protein
MAQGNSSGRIWEDISASYRRTVGELHAVVYPGFPSIQEPGRSGAFPQIEDPATPKDSVLEDRLQAVDASRDHRERDERERDDPEIDR